MKRSVQRHIAFVNGEADSNDLDLYLRKLHSHLSEQTEITFVHGRVSMLPFGQVEGFTLRSMK